MRRAKNLLFVLMFFAVSPLWAQKITESEALKLAETFIGKQPAYDQSGAKKTKGRQLRLVKDKSTEGALYLFNRGKDAGFVIVSAEEHAPNPIVGYSDHGSIDPKDMPDAMKEWLQFYVREAKAMERQHLGGHADYISSQEQRMQVRNLSGEVGPLLGEIAWNQGDPYNQMTPTINGEHALTGCVATATAQIMYYHRWPQRGTGSFTYYDNGCGKTLTANFGEHTYDWDAMTPTYSGTSSANSGNAVALLMSDVGIAVQMEYSLTFSASYTSDVAPALREYFGYDPAVFSARRSDFSTEDWTNLLKRELNAGRPVVYSGVPLHSSAGHAFVCDGFNDQDYYHFNWGWSGGGNGWFLLSTMNPNGGDGFTEEHEMVCNIARPGQADAPVESTFTWEYVPETATLHCSGTGNMPEYYIESNEFPWKEYKNQVKHIVLDRGITSVAVYAFNRFSQLETVSLPDGLKFISNEAFSETPLRSITFPQSLVQISAYAFRDTKLERVDLGPNVSFVSRPFAEIPTLKEINVSDANAYFTSVDGALYDKAVTSLIAYPNAANEVTIPASVTHIGLGALQGGQHSEVILPDQIDSMEDMVFMNSTVHRVVLPAKLLTLPNSTFMGCNNLEEVVFNKKLREIGDWVFYNCGELRSLTLHRNIKRIGDATFLSSRKLNSITCMAEQAPEIKNGTLAGISETGVLTVPEGSDYSSWLDKLGTGWTIAYVQPEERDPNGSWEGTVWTGYVNEDMFWTDNPNAPMYTYRMSSGYVKSVSWQDETYECAMRIDNAANPLTKALNISGGKLYGLSVMTGEQNIQGCKVWISTNLPQTVDDADILVMDAGADFKPETWHDIIFDEPVTLPEGPCYAGLCFMVPNQSGGQIPYNWFGLAIADAMEGDCYVRDSQTGEEWQDDIRKKLYYYHNIPAMRMLTKGRFMENDVTPLSTMDVSVLKGEGGKTTLSMLNMGNAPVMESIGIKLYDSSTKSWGDVQTIKTDCEMKSVGQRLYLDVNIPAKAAAGCYTDSVAIAEINGYPCPHSTSTVPMKINVLESSLKHNYLVEVDAYIYKGASPRAYVGQKLLEQTMPDEVVTYVNHWGDLMTGYDKYSPVESPGVVLDGRYQLDVDPYYGTGTEGFGMADYIRNQKPQPAIAEISATAEWRDEAHTSLRFNTTVHSLIDLDEDRLSVRYIVVADGLHGEGDEWAQRNGLSGEDTDDENLKPFTEQPYLIQDYVYDAVGIFCPWYYVSPQEGEQQRMIVPQMKAGSTVNMEHCITAVSWEEGKQLYTPEVYGIDYGKMKVIAMIEDNLTKRIVNCVRVDLPAEPVIKADCAITAKAGEGGQVKIGEEVGKVVSTLAAPGDRLLVTAVPERGYAFDYWYDGVNNYKYGNPYEMTVMDPKVLNAYFRPLQYILTFFVDGHEYYEVLLKYNEPITLPSIPEKFGYVFYRWEGLPEDMVMPDENIRVTAAFAILGDVNVDDKVNITDAVDIVNDRLGYESAGYVHDLSDVNSDKQFTIADAIGVINIMYDGSAAMYAPRKTAVSGESLSLLQMNDGTVALDMNCMTDYSAFQFDVVLPDGVDMSSVMLNTSRCPGFAVKYNKIDSNVYRVVAYNLANTPVTTGNDNLLTLGITGASGLEDVMLTNIHFSTIKAVDVEFEDMVLGMTSGISSHDVTEDDVEYNIAGLRVNKSYRGLVIGNGKKTIRK